MHADGLVSWACMEVSLVILRIKWLYSLYFQYIIGLV